MRLSSLLFSLLVLAGTLLAQDTNFQAGPQYLITNSSNQFLQPIATPSLSLDAPLPALVSLPEVGPAVENQPYVATLSASAGPDLFPIYYGYPPIPVVELVSEEVTGASSVPANTNTVVILSTASIGHTDTGDTLGEIAWFWKAHHTSVARIYSNADLQRLNNSQTPTVNGSL